MTVSLGGLIKMLDLNKNQEKSWISSIVQAEAHQFPWICLAATSGKGVNNVGHVIVLAFHNHQPPYVFVNCKTKKDFQDQTAALNGCYDEWSDNPGEITYCRMDTTSNTVIVSTKEQKLLFFEIKKINFEGNMIYYCEMKCEFYPADRQIGLNSTIQCISAYKGILIACTCL